MPPLLRTDTGNFNRFLTSLGLLLLAAALLVPYFYFRNTDILIIPKSDLRTLTEQGRSAVIERQNAIAALEPWVIGTAVLLGVLGAGFLISGGLRLKAAQESEDEETELRKDRARLEVRNLSPEERAKRVVQKAREGTRGDAETRPESSPLPEIPRAGAAPRPADDFLRERQDAVARIEQAIEDAFESVALDNYRLKLQLNIRSTTDAVQLDGLFEARDRQQPDVVLKTKVVFDPTFVSKTARSTADGLIAQLSRYQSMTHRTADGWLVAIVPKESEQGLDATSLDAASSLLNSAMATSGSATVVREAELSELPQHFIATFGHTFLL